MFGSSLERQLTAFAGIVVFVSLVAACCLLEGVWPHWREWGWVLLLTLMATLAYRLVLVSHARRLNSLSNALRRLSDGDLSVRLAWANDIQEAVTDAQGTELVRASAAQFFNSFRQPFALDSAGTAKSGKLSVPILRCGTEVLNNNFEAVDRFEAKGVTTTLFVVWRGSFVRISTSLHKPDGSRAMGTMLDRSSPAYAQLIQGKSYSGRTRLFGKHYVVQYEPIRSAGGDIIGALFVGLKLERPKTKLGQLDALGVDFNTFVADMTQFLTAMAEAGEAIVDANIALTQNIARVTESSGQQSASAQSVAAAVEQMAVATESIANGARETEAISEESRQTAESGGLEVGGMVNEIGGIASRFDTLTELMNQLGAHSEDINGIVDVIRSLSDKTNLLALNAAIEAARAGEYGRGFAVVADEVRNLAAQTVTATEQIAELTSTIENQIGVVAREAHASSGQVQQGVKLAAKAKASLADIVKMSDQTLGKVHEITEATREQVEASKEVAANLDGIAQRATQETQAVQAISDEILRLEQMTARFHGLVYRFNY